MARVLTDVTGCPAALEDDVPDPVPVDPGPPRVVIVVDGVEYAPKDEFRTIVVNGALSGSDALVDVLGRPASVVREKTQTEAVQEMVVDYALDHLDRSDDDLPFVEAYVVWQCHILGNKKWLLSTNLPDGMYYEVTYSRDKDEYYLDAYKKFQNVRYKPTDVGLVPSA